MTKILLVHYHLRDGGVKTVMQRQANALVALCHIVEILTATNIQTHSFDKRVSFAFNKHLDYLNTDDYSAEQLKAIYDAILNTFVKYDNTWTIWVHNATLGKNPVLSDVLIMLAKQNKKIVFQCHDFAEERPQMADNLSKYFATKGINDYTKYLYQDIKTLTYLCVNKNDTKRAIFNNIKVDYILNPVELKLNNTNVSKQDIATKLNADCSLPWFVYPIRAIKRKNIIEILLLSLLAPLPAQFFITLAPQNDEEKDYYNRVVELSKQLALPIFFDTSATVAFEDLLSVCDTVVSTSIKEGFGMAFLEPWLIDKPVAGRYLKDVCTDFENDGIIFDHFYKEIFVKEYQKDFAYLSFEEQKEILLKIKSNKDYASLIIKDNPSLSLVFDEVSKDIISKNKRVVEDKYSAKSNAQCIIHNAQ